MFTRRKKSYGAVIGASIVITLCILIFVIAWPTEPGTTQNPNAEYSSGDNVLNPTENEQSPSSGNLSPNSGDGTNNSQDEQGKQPDGDDIAQNTQNNSKPSGISATTDSYYLVKYVDGFVKVFFFDSNGNSIELEKTGIAFDVLNPSDQRLLSNGIKASSQEELATILQDFEG